METIDVKGLPEPVAKALQSVVEALRNQRADELHDEQIKCTETARDLPVLPGTVFGPLTRREIYEDVG